MSRSYTIKSSQSVTLTLLLGGADKREPALSPYGPVRAGLTTMPRTKEDQALTELLNSLERQIADLSIRSCEVLNMFLSDTKHLVRHTSSFSSTTITECDSI
jgi:hypothetical protein